MSATQIERQRISFDAKAERYTAHHSDSTSQAYRTRFFRDRLLSFDLRGMRVLDGMCAGGPDYDYLARRGAVIDGLEISPKAAAIYSAKSGRPCHVASMHETGLPSEGYDVVWIVGGLHHILPQIEQCVAEIHRLLKPGGYFCNFEPSADTWVNQLRNLAYRTVGSFDPSEGAISYAKQMRPLLRLGFEEELSFYGGNVAYMPIMNSGVLRIPLGVKKFYAGPLSAIEATVGTLAPKLYWCARWRKT